MVSFQTYVRESLRLAAVPLAPEIVLHTAHAGSGLSRRGGSAGKTPYWAYPWAGGVALVRYILDHSDELEGRRVLDVGTGSGLAAIAAVKAGARPVIAIDIDPEAVVVARINAAANGVTIDAAVADMATSAVPAAGIVLAGDVFYDAEAARTAEAFLTTCRSAGARVLVGDPGRRFLPIGRLSLLASYSIADFGSASANATGNVYEFD